MTQAGERLAGSTGIGSQADPVATGRDYATTYRRILFDMQVPDWDPRFLRDFDPQASARAAATAGATGLMVYFQSHTGLCNWPTASGKQHAAFVGRDVMQPLLASAHESGLAVCAYYSVNFNNWARNMHPDWGLVPASTGVIGGGLLQRERYGICCFNHPAYAAFVATQIDEIVTGYDIDAFFCDMVWWMSVCLCTSCRDRYRAETGREIPETVDWLDPHWCDFQAARERWLASFAGSLRDTVRRHRPDIPVYHNFALGTANWSRGLPLDSARQHDFLGGDFYGGSEEQLLVARLMLNLSERRPVEFMTTITANLAEHERLKPQAVLDSQVLAATASHSAFLAILAYDPDGRLNPAAAACIGRMFAQSMPYEPYLGGTPIEDIAIYFSSASKMSFAENGKPLCEASQGSAFEYPHLRSVLGACRILQQAHLPFGVITRRDVDSLDRFRVVILPNVLRMDREEVTAFREYVRRGGRLYASRYTSLTGTEGTRSDDFMLADVFGCHYGSQEDGRIVYLSPADARCEAAIAPERALGHWLEPEDRRGAVRLKGGHEGQALMTLTLPYAYPSRGHKDGSDWSSIHSFPPWQHTDYPGVVEHAFGAGRAIYSAADLEAGNTASHDALVLALVKSLLDGPAAFSSTAHPDVWMTAFEQSSRGRWVVAFANQSTTLPPLPSAPCQFELRPPAGSRFTGLRSAPADAAVPCTLRQDGSMVAEVGSFSSMAMFVADLAPAPLYNAMHGTRTSA